MENLFKKPENQVLNKKEIEQSMIIEDVKPNLTKSEILKEYGMLESNIPINHIYWKL